MREAPFRFGKFELIPELAQLRKSGTIVRLPHQPFRVLCLLVSRAGTVVTREEIRQELWGSETFVDFDQGVNTAIKQIRDALKEDAERPLYVETVPKRGYRFIAPVEMDAPGPADVASPKTDLNLSKALWLNIAELQLAEVRCRERRIYIAAAAVLGVLLIAVIVMLVR